MFSLRISYLDTVLEATSPRINIYPLRSKMMVRMEGEKYGVSDPVPVGYTIYAIT